MSLKLKKLDSLATSSPSSQRIFEGDISPMDYRPQQKRRRNKKKNHMPNAAVDHDTIDTSNGMLKEYVDQWTKSSSPTKSTRKREIKNNVVTAETNNDKQDSSSASVISTSSHSAVDNNNYEGIVRSEGEVAVNKDIELEYGQLAFMKKDLERKMRLYQHGSTCITSTTPHNNNTVEENNKLLELEYGKLSFMKQELEHKMSIYKMDAEKVGHQLSSTTRKEAPTRVFHAPSPSRNVMMDGESRMLVSASKNAINIERPDNHDLAAPSRQDVEFGVRAFQRIMSERRQLPRVEGVDVTEHYQVPHKRRRRGYQYSGDEYDDDDDDDYSVKHMDDSKSMSIHRGDEKKKRKRKRRVVETRITRVFHEESEDAESRSTSTSPSCRTSSRLDYDRRQQARQSLILPFNQGLKYTSINKEEKRNRIQNNNKKSSPSSVSGSRGRRNKQMRAKRQSSMLEGLS